MTQTHIALTATPRTEKGKRVAKFRYQGSLPIVVYGEGKNMELWVKTHEFDHVYKKAGSSSVIDLIVEDKKYPVLVKSIQEHPLTGKTLHADLLRVNLKKPIVAEVPVVTVGESPAIKEQNAVLITVDDTVNVEALPDNMPHELTIDLSQFAEVGAQITVAHLPTAPNYTIKDDPERILFQITAHKEESIEAETEVELPEVPGEAGEGQPVEAPAEEKKEE